MTSLPSLLLAAAVIASCAADADPECDPLGGRAEQKVECGDGDPRTVDLCLPPGWCEHAPVECDPTDPLAVSRAACAEETGCAAVRCKGDGTCVTAETCQ